MIPVLVTTKYRGVFFGYLPDREVNGSGKLTLQKARNCLYWSSDCKGFLGLASHGPTDSCRVGPQVKEITLYGITSVTPVEETAVEKWDAGPWS